MNSTRTLIAAALALSVGSVLAASGDLDATFGITDTGLTTVFPPSGGAFSAGTAIQADGKIVVGASLFDQDATDVGAMRFTATGAPDPQFGQSGIATLDLGGISDFLADIAIQKDGRILLFGTREDPVTGRDFFVARLLPNGSPDPQFGSGGKAVVDFAGLDDSANAGIVLFDGRIVAVGQANTNSRDFGVVMLTSSGQPDPTFSGDGKANFDMGSNLDLAAAVAPLKKGKLLIGGQIGSGASSQLALLQILSNGNPDPAFGAAGQVFADFPNATIQQMGAMVVAKGKILAVGHGQVGDNFDILVAQFSAKGAPVSGFGTQGQATIDFDAGSFDSTRGALVQKDGKIVISLNISASGANNAGVLRLTKTGLPDPKFSQDGKVQLPLAGQGTGGEVVTDKAGRYVLGNTSGNAIAVLRVLAK